MKRFSTAILVLCFGTLAGFSQDAPKPPSEYGVLLAKVKGGDLSIDFQKLRFSYMDSDERKQAKDTFEQDRQMWKSFNAEDYADASKNADAVLEEKFVDLNAHYVEFRAYTGLHDTDKAEFHRSVVKGLLDSILYSGDAKSAKTAYVVIAIDEEYVVLKVMGLKSGMQALVKESGHSYDRLDATDLRTNQSHCILMWTFL